MKSKGLSLGDKKELRKDAHRWDFVKLSCILPRSSFCNLGRRIIYSKVWTREEIENANLGYGS